MWFLIGLKISEHCLLDLCVDLHSFEDFVEWHTGLRLVLRGFQSYVLKMFYAGWMCLILYLGEARTFYVHTGRDSEIASNCHVVSVRNCWLIITEPFHAQSVGRPRFIIYIAICIRPCPHHEGIWEMEVYLHTLSTSALDEWEWFTSCSGRFARSKYLCYPWIRKWMGPRATIEVLWEEKISYTYHTSNTGPFIR